MNIKNPEAHQLAREVAAELGLERLDERRPKFLLRWL